MPRRTRLSYRVLFKVRLLVVLRQKVTYPVFSTDLTDKYEKLRAQVAAKLASLAELLQSRRTFEEEVEKCEHWLNQAEVATSGDMRTTNVALLEELLTKVNLDL